VLDEKETTLIPAACAVIMRMSWPLCASQSGTDRWPPHAPEWAEEGRRSVETRSTPWLLEELDRARTDPSANTRRADVPWLDALEGC
jgi:hypothetical protein